VRIAQHKLCQRSLEATSGRGCDSAHLFELEPRLYLTMMHSRKARLAHHSPVVVKSSGWA